MAYTLEGCFAYIHLVFIWSVGMQNIAVIFGGKSVEHDISVLTGMGVLTNISQKYNVIPIYITKSGIWLTGEKLKSAENYKPEPKGHLCQISLDEPYLNYKIGLKKVKTKIDCAVLALHGGIYEGGAVQGLLELAGIPYTSASILGSSLCMDKVLTKNLLKCINIHTPRFVYAENCDDLMAKITKSKLSLPIIIKPARAGSSIGITKVVERDKLKDAILYAFNFDTKVIAESCFEDFREMNISAFKLNDEIKCSSIEEVCTKFFSFEQKYERNSKITRIVPAEIDKKVQNEIEEIARKVYSTFDLNGVVRIDFLLKDETIYLNEINTIPGSFAFYLWREAGITLGKLISLNIEETLRNAEKKRNVTYDFSSHVLDDLGEIGKIVEK